MSGRYINYKDAQDYSKYKCPYEHLEKECGHKLNSPEGYENVDSVWCPCGFRGPVLYLDPGDLRLIGKEPKRDFYHMWE